MSAVFVTGTGTGVGKTFVTSGLARLFRGLGRQVNALKPVVSGFDPALPWESDSAVLLEAAGREITPEEIERISPWRFRAPLSPDMAARAEVRAIGFQELAGFCRAAAAGDGAAVLIEGVGGIMVPLDDRHTVLDLMAALGQPLILVCGSYLGTLSHTLSAQEVILRHGLSMRAIVVSESEGSPPPFEATLETLGHFAKAPLIGLRRQQAAAENDAAFACLAKLLA
jgi:dethiobiotin synthetase